MQRLMGVLLVLFLFCSVGLAQTTPTVDPQAASILAQSLQAMGVSNLSGISSTQTSLQVSEPDGTTGTATVLTLGFQNMRMEWQGPDGSSIFVVNGVYAASKDSSGQIDRMSRLSVTSGGITEIPLLSIIGQWSTPGMGVTYVGQVTLRGTTFYHLRIERPLDPKIGLGAYDIACDVFIDAKTMLPAALVFPLRAPSNLRVVSRMRIDYSDYRKTSGILIPYKFTYSVGNTVLDTEQVTQFAVNVATSASDFELR